ncbi:prefoldin subunit beta [archaeon]|nr:prefoldin subunit beta [archaeon]NCP79017.1 prefoldin subunit beta [archaeon]NCP97600.1 prefoldin subunit beta [archaeon]NCQ06784.1 prefoldin subunit beta [archaeon]NCQ50580.1 prefoldin subunit beta [archaeon]
MSKDNNMVNTYRQQLMYLSQQKQQLQVQVNVLDSTVKELENTKETKVYKGVGNIFILKDKTDVIKETKETKETVELRLKTVEKQENDTLKRLNDLSKENKKEDKPKDESNTEGIA